jgi:hypothetical protein
MGELKSIVLWPQGTTASLVFMRAQVGERSAMAALPPW